MAAETAVLQPTKVLALQNEPDVLAAYWVCKCRGKQLYTMNLRYWQSTRRAIASVVVNKDIPNKHSVNCIICKYACFRYGKEHLQTMCQGQVQSFRRH